MPITKVGSDMPIRETAWKARLVQWPRVEPGIDAHRHADQQGEQRGADRELDGGRQALQDHAVDRLGGAVAQAEPAARGVADEMQELDRCRIVQAELLAQRLALDGRRVLADHAVDRIADVAEQEEGHEAHRQQHGDGLDQSAQDESEHFPRILNAEA